MYLKGDKMKTKEEIETEYDQLTGHKNSVALQESAKQYIDGYINALEWVLGLE